MPKFCESCGSSVSRGAAFCGACGQPLIGAAVITTAVATAARSRQDPERVFLDENGIKVTNARFVVAGQTFAMSGITSVKVDVEHPSKVGPVIPTALGALAAFNGIADQTRHDALIPGLIVAAVGIAWFRSRRPKYHVLFMSASGEEKPYHSADEDLVRKIVKAISDAIIHRG
jgi:hypothetical protein